MKNNTQRKSFTFLIISILFLITFLPKGLSQVTKTATVISKLPDVTVTVTAPPPVANPTDTVDIPKGPDAGGPAGPAQPAPGAPGAPPPAPPGGAPPGGAPPGAPPGGAPPDGAPAPQPGAPGITPSPGVPQPPNNAPSPGGQPNNNSPTPSAGNKSPTPSKTASNLLTGHVPVPSIRPDTDSNSGNIVQWNLVVIMGGLIMSVLVL